MLRSTHRAWLLTVPLLLLLTFWLLRVIWAIQMRPDETLVYVFTRFDIGYAVNYLATQDIQAPLWLALFWIWRHLLAGDSEFAGRMLGLLFSLITLALVYRIGRDWFGKARYGLFAVLILGANAYFCLYALEIRPYPLVLLLSALSMLIFERWMCRQSWRMALAYGVVLALMFYVHYFLIFLVLAQGIYSLLCRRSRRVMVQAAVAGALAFVLWLPWLPSFLNQMRLLHQVVEQAGNGYGVGIGTASTTQPTSLAAIVDLAWLTTNGLPLIYAAVIGLGVLLILRTHLPARWRARFGLALLWGIGVPVIALVLNFVAEVYTPRYVAYLSVGVGIVMAAVFATLRRPLVRNAALGVFVLFNLIVLPSSLPVRVPYREIFPAIKAQAGDVAYFADMVEQFLTWQADAYLSPVLTRITTHDTDAAVASRRVWFLTGNWFDAGVHAQFEQLEPTHPVQQVIGQCPVVGWCYYAQLMEAPPLDAPEVFGAEMAFWGADVDAVSREAISTRLWWRVEQAPTLDYSISLQLVNAAGEIVTQKDGPIIHYGVDTVQTSQLQPEKIYIDFRALDLPPDLPAGAYTLELVVYQSWDGERLALPDGKDALALETLQLP